MVKVWQIGDGTYSPPLTHTQLTDIYFRGSPPNEVALASLRVCEGVRKKELQFGWRYVLYFVNSPTFLGILHSKWVIRSFQVKSSENHTPRVLVEDSYAIFPLFNVSATGTVNLLLLLLYKAAFCLTPSLSESYPKSEVFPFLL